MVDPPLAGSVQVTTALVPSLSAITIGVLGPLSAPGVTALDVPTGTLPNGLDATTVKVRGSPLVRSVNGAENVEPFVVMTSPAEDVTVYRWIVPATAEGGVHVTTAPEPSAIAVTMGITGMTGSRTPMADAGDTKPKTEAKRAATTRLTLNFLTITRSSGFDVLATECF